MHRLSKTKLVNAWQCGKRLWLEKYRPELSVVTPDMQQRFDTGNQVGDIAQALFPDGILIEHNDELELAIEETASRLDEAGSVALFEATFRAQGVLVRADVLVRDEAGQVRLIEVKSSGEVKDYHLQDCAIQLWVLEQCGLSVARVELAHVNKEFVYPGGGDYAGLLTFADVTAEARELQPQVPRLIAEAREVLDGPEPEISPGKHCRKPYPCPLEGHCLTQATGEAEWPIHWLPGGMTLHSRLLNDGYRDIRDIPAGELTHVNAERCRRVTVSGEPELSSAAADELRAHGWPRYYFDFETLSPTVPVFVGTRPFQMQAFQWSCHVEHKDGRIEHLEFLPDMQLDAQEPPMRACAEALIAALGTSGPVFMYHHYERTVINSLIDWCPELTAELQHIDKRLVDLLPITRSNYCHPNLRGSWSIKAVLPTVAADLSYDELTEVTVGTEAGVRFLEMIDAETPVDRVPVLREALLRYCKLDTEAMVRLAWFLEGRQSHATGRVEAG